MSSLHTFFQAAMGPCSNCPADIHRRVGNEGFVTIVRRNQTPTPSYGQSHMVTATKRKNTREQRDIRNRHFDAGIDSGPEYSYASPGISMNPQLSPHHKTKYDYNMTKVLNGSRNECYSPNTRSTEKDLVSSTTPSEEIPPPPPDGAVRTRCYRLNLDTPLLLPSSRDCFGPMTYDPPEHLLPKRFSNRRKAHSWSSMTDLKVSLSDDISMGSEKSPTKVAISTAKIFRGIAVDKNGTIVGQNARASRSSRGKQAKQGEKSRQACKIDKANDLIDGTENSGMKENEGKNSNMVSLVIVGEYDDMKQLVHDGAKSLRDAEGLPDEALLAINRPRQGMFGRNATNDQIPSTPSPSRKRQPPQSAPPKLKAHPRDRLHSRRRSGGGSGGANMSVSLLGGVDSDWSDALNFSRGFHSVLNCGMTQTNSSALSPNKTKSPMNVGRMRGRYSPNDRIEGRNESSTKHLVEVQMGTARDSPRGRSALIL